jgi:hypothetical protein
MLHVSLNASGFAYTEKDGTKLFRDHFKGVTYYQTINNCSIEDRAKN